MPQNTLQSTFNVIEAGQVHKEVEIEGCEGDYDGFNDLQEVRFKFKCKTHIKQNAFSCNTWSVILYSEFLFIPLILYHVT